jgi:putative endonuclease
VLALFRRLFARLTPAPAASRDPGFGRRGERAARRALVRAGYRILARNLRTPGGEIDLLALDGETLVLVEVKSTARAGFHPADRVDRAKRRRLCAAKAWLARRRGFGSRPFRFDVVAVTAEGRALRVALLRGGFRARPG